MKIKITSVFLMLFLIGISSHVFSNEIDYSKLFLTVKSSINPIDVTTEKAQLLESNLEFASALEYGLNSFNVLAPYISMEKDLKSVLNELAHFKLTLRSPKSTEIYQKAVYATVLVVAPELGIGTGFIVNKYRGLIITNFHVTCGLKNILVAFYNENIQDPSKLKYYPASVLKYSARRDIAVLKLLSSLPNLQELNLEETEGLNIGEEVHLIGHPEELTWTYSHGLITAIRNKFRFGEEEVADVIQIDASISNGNSGGPLLNDNGKVIGLVTFSSSDPYAQNLNFAVSSKEINHVITSSKNEDTAISYGLQKLYGLKLLSLSDVLQDCKAYKVDEDGDGKTDYISLVNSKTKMELFRYIKEIEIEIEPNNIQIVNLLSMDISDDGIFDILMCDYDLDNKFDAIMYDIDFDGQPDIVGIDAEGKGIITEAWIL